MKKAGYIFLFLTTIFHYSFSQEIKVIDKSTSTPISNVTINSKTDQKFQITNENGMANLSDFSDSSLLEFRHPSYLTVSTTKIDLAKKNYTLYLELKSMQMEEVIISANKWEQNKEEIPNEILVISPEVSSFNNPQTAADLLEGTGQVFVQKSQQGGGSPMMRGFGANAVLIVVDGVRMNNAIFRGGNLQNVINIDPNMLEGAEIIAGPGSVIYGSDALGGVMDFHTKEIEINSLQKIQSTAFLRFSSASKERTGHANWTISGKEIGWFGGFTFSKYGSLRSGSNRPSRYPDLGKRNFYVERINGSDSIIPNENPNIQVPSGFSQFNTVQKLKWQFHPKISLEYIFNISTTSDIPRYDRLIEIDEEELPLNSEWYYGPQFWMMNALKLKTGNNQFWEEMTITISSQQFKESRNDRKFQEVDQRSRSEKVNLYSFNFDAFKTWEKQDLFYGMEFNHNSVISEAFSQNIESGDYSSTTTRYPNGGSDTYSYAFYLNTKRELFLSKLYFNGGLRFTHNNLNAVNTDEHFPYHTISNNNEAVVGNLGLVWNPDPNLRLSLLSSSGFRSPNIDDIAKVFDSEPGTVMVPNPGLKPEYSYNLETGFNWSPSKELTLKANAFYSWLRDAMVRSDFTFNGEDSILYDGTLSKVQALTNTGKAAVYGFDTEIVFQFGKNWGLTSYLNYMKGKDLITDKSLRHATPIFGMTSVYYQKEKIHLELFSRYNGKIKFDNLPPSEQNKAYLYTEDGSLSWYTINVRGAYSFSNHLMMNMSVENILDKQYRTYSSGISAPGINFIISLKATL